MVTAMIRAMVSAALLLTLLAGHCAFAETGCYCETGNQPRFETPLFKLGCDIWLAQQTGCAFKKTVAENFDYANPDEPAFTDLKVGYVGHWGSSAQTVLYLLSSILPVMRDKGVSVEVDNTACSGMDNPPLVLSSMTILKLLLKPEQTLLIRGNQTESVGEWSIAPGFGTVNFPATVSSSSDTIIYPPCQDYLDDNCLKAIQAKQPAQCDSGNGQLTTLYCCTTFDRGGRGREIQRDAWMPLDQCGG
jgi:hypothetical protein